MGFGRRDLFRFGAATGGFGLLTALGWSVGKRPPRTASERTAQSALLPIDCSTDRAGTDTAYPARYSPSPYVQPGSRDFLHSPPPPRPGEPGRLLQFELPIVETTLEVANGRNARVWAYGGTVPGPILRATLGDRVRIILTNHASVPHSLHFHGAHDVTQDGLGRVPPGERQIYEFTAAPAGLHPYHCHVPPYTCHIGKGMYGSFIVDPVEGRPAAREFVLCLCGFDIDGTGRNDTYAWNGIAGYYQRFPLKAAAGELVRIYLTNMVENDGVASFHLHSHTFDVFRSGTSLTPHEHTDMVTLGPAERAILEFRLPRRGRYMFHPHQSHMAERGAMGWITAV